MSSNKFSRNILSLSKFIKITLSFLIVLNNLNGFVDGNRLSRRECETSNDCNENQCCTETPIGIKLCLDYLQQGELCFFRYRTPTCGCAKGLKCVSTSPMQPGDWNHDYVCARVRPFQHHKLMPYFDDPEINELPLY